MKRILKIHTLNLAFKVFLQLRQNITQKGGRKPYLPILISNLYPKRLNFRYNSNKDLLLCSSIVTPYKVIFLVAATTRNLIISKFSLCIKAPSSVFNAVFQTQKLLQKFKFLPLRFKQFLKTSFAIVALSSLSFADNANISKNIIESASEGRNVVNESKLEPIDINRASSTLYKSETILNWHYALQKENKNAMEVVGKKGENLFVSNLKQENLSKEQEKESQIELVAVKGYCFIKEEINVGKQPSSFRVDCQSNVGGITLFANLVNVNEKAALMADPKYIEKDKVRFNIKSAIVLNEEKTSYNLATFVNDRKIAEIGWGALSYSSDELKNATNEYLKALQESKREQKVEYATTTDGAGNSYMQPIQTTNTQKPQVSDYFYTAGVNIVADIAKSTAEVFKKDLPYLYQIVPQTKIWIDLQVEKKGVYVK